MIRRAVVIGNGCAGAENQCLGLVRALGLASRYSLYRVTRPRGGINEWLRWLPVSIHNKLVGFLKSFFCRSGTLATIDYGKSELINVPEADCHQIAYLARDSFDRDGPLLLVASGRDTISVSSAVRKLAPGSVFVVQIQHPRTCLDRFDLIVTPHHDYYPLTPHGQRQIPWLLRKCITPREPPDRRVILTVGALHHADSATLRNAAAAWRHELEPLSKPLLVVNVGGPTGSCRYNGDLAVELKDKLNNILWSCGSIKISFSRRTPKKVSNIIMSEFRAKPKVKIWDGQGPNPHMGHLAWADAFVITADSISMLSEACSTGKPVYVIGSERCTWKFADFQKTLLEKGLVRPFTGKEDLSMTWSYSPLNDASEVAAKVIDALNERGWKIQTFNGTT